jgi:hypothetical protein
LGPWLTCTEQAAYLAFTDTDQQVTVARFTDLLNGQPVVRRFGETSPYGPAIVSVKPAIPGEETLVLAWTGTGGNRLNARYGSWANSIKTKKVTLDVTSKDGPYLTYNAQQSLLGMGFQGTNDHIYIRYSFKPSDPVFSTRWSPPDDRCAARPAAPPAIAVNSAFGTLPATPWAAWAWKRDMSSSPPSPKA